MKAIMLMFDSLNKRLLSAYGSDRAITPNFQRLNWSGLWVVSHESFTITAVASFAL